MARHEAPNQYPDIPQGAEQYNRTVNPTVYQAPRQDTWERGQQAQAPAPERIPFKDRVSTKIGAGVLAIGLATGAGVVGYGMSKSSEARATDTIGADPARGYELNPPLLDNGEQQNTDPYMGRDYMNSPYEIDGVLYEGFEQLQGGVGLNVKNYPIDDSEKNKTLANKIVEDYLKAFNGGIHALDTPEAQARWDGYGVEEAGADSKIVQAAKDIYVVGYDRAIGLPDDTEKLFTQGLVWNIENPDNRGSFRPHVDSTRTTNDSIEGNGFTRDNGQVLGSLGSMRIEFVDDNGEPIEGASIPTYNLNFERAEAADGESYLMLVGGERVANRTN